MKRVTLYLTDETAQMIETNKWEDNNHQEAFKVPYRWGKDDNYCIINPDHIVKIKVEKIKD